MEEKTYARGLDNSGNIEGNSKTLLRRQLGSVPPGVPQHASAGGHSRPRRLPRPQRAAAARRSGPQPGGARWSAVWTGSAGWDRVGPSAVPWGDGLGKGGWEGWKG
jgi:hypothetical protein